MTPLDPLRLLAAAVLALVLAWAFDRGAMRPRLRPPGFATPWRRIAALVVMAGTFFLAIFVPLFAGEPPEVDFEAVGPLDLFGAQLMLLLAVIAWTLLGFAGQPSQPQTVARHDPVDDEPAPAGPSDSLPPADVRASRTASWPKQLGLVTRDPLRELWMGLVAGVGAWGSVLIAALVLGILLAATGAAPGLVEAGPSPIIVWLAGLPVALRLLLSLSAGVAEELFFRGLLQPRIGVAASTAVFVVGHMSYGQPLMLAGLTLLSLIYAWLVRWRGSIWAAIIAHTLFDAVQLLLVIPAALRAIEA